MRVSDAQRTQWRHEISTDRVWMRERARRWVDVVAVIAVAAAFVDALITYLVLDGSVHLERNPLVVSVMRVIGIGPTLTLGALLRIGIVVALVFLATHAVRGVVRAVAAGAIVLVAAWWCVVVFANAVVAAHLA